MLLADVNLQYVKGYLKIDHNEDDARIQSHIDTAKNYIAVSHGYDEINTSNNDYLSDLAMVLIQDLYDNGTITSMKSVSFLSIDRRF